ncbi:MAG: zinc ribbon domain-containing protein, partial [Candidatus Lokiarchaeota archaeon]|nr:zinc ribbon domain-containing protein [Candidatus Lokiarchaeota archaeon]
ATIEDISQKTGITFRDVQAIVLDLKARGLLRGKFSSTTGEMKHIEVTTANPQTETIESKVSYCPNCGTAKVKGPSVYCSYCGTKL